MEQCKPVSTPIESVSRNKVDQVKEEDIIIEQKPYREVIGCLMYLMLTTRPDLSFATNFYSRFQSNATEVDWKGLKRILRYLQRTLNYGLFYPANVTTGLRVFTDADWGSSNDRKSTSGFLFEIFGCVVQWTTRKQKSVALSSTEAEYIALASACADLIWVKNLLKDVGELFKGPVQVFEDNQSCIHLLDKTQPMRLKHIDIKYHYVKDLVQRKIIVVSYIPSNQQKADILTKGLATGPFEKLRKEICVMEFT